MKKKLAYRLINEDVLTESELEGFDEGQEILCVKEVGLVKLKSGEFQFIYEGEFKPILSGHKWILIKSNVAKILNGNAPEQVKSRPVKIFRKATGEEWLDYCELEIKNEIEYSKYSQMECKGIEVFQMMNEIIFVSPELKETIEDRLCEEGIKMKQELPLMVG